MLKQKNTSNFDMQELQREREREREREYRCVILLLYTHCAKFSESGTVGFGQEGLYLVKLGTDF